MAKNGVGKMQQEYRSGYNPEVCLAPRRADFGVGASPRMHLLQGNYFTCFSFFKLESCKVCTMLRSASLQDVLIWVEAAPHMRLGTGEN